jgi:hypothetical protein
MRFWKERWDRGSFARFALLRASLRRKELSFLRFYGTTESHALLRVAAWMQDRESEKMELRLSLPPVAKARRIRHATAFGREASSRPTSPSRGGLYFGLLCATYPGHVA